MKAWEISIVMVLCICIAGCALLGMPRKPESKPAPPAPPANSVVPAPPLADDAPLKDRLAYWENRATVLEGATARLNAEAKDARKQAESARREISLAPLRALTTWAQWIGGAVALLAVVAGVLLKVGVGLPVGGRLILGVGLSGVALAASAAGLGSALPWIGPIGLGILVLAVLAGLGWAAYTWKRGGEAVAAEWRRYAVDVPQHIRKKLDEESVSLQGKRKAIVDKLLKAVS